MYSYSKDPLRLAALAPPPFWSAAKARLAAGLDWLGASWPVKAARALAAAMAAESLARRTAHELKGWDDHMLRDIGLERMNVDAAVRGVDPTFQWQPDCDPDALRRLDHLR